MKKTIYAISCVIISIFIIKTNVKAQETINLNTEDDYFNAITTINTSEETDFVMNLESDVVLSNYPTTSNPVSVSNNKNVTILGNGHKLSISNIGSYGHHPIMNVGSGVTITLGKSDGTDTLSIEGGGTTVSTSESLFNVSGTVNMYAGVSIGNNHSGNGALTGGAFDLNTNGTINMFGGKIHDNSSTGVCLGGAVVLDDSNTTFNMYDGLFENNRTCSVGAAYGGAIGIYDVSQTAKVNIEGGTFKNNSSLYGGAIGNIFGILSVKNAIFENNTAKNEDEDDGSGGAILEYANIDKN